MTTRLEIGVLSDTGRVRTLNEDSYGIAAQLGMSNDLLARKGQLFAVADGMGGHAAGEVASQLAISTLFEVYYQDPDPDLRRSLLAAIQTANTRVYEQAEANEMQAGMGTTLVAAVLHNDQWLIANAGDSRAYLVRNGKAQQATRDHSWVAEQMAAGVLTAEEGRNHPYRNIVTRSLGQMPDLAAELFLEPAMPGDALLLCSDGLSNLVSPRSMAQAITTHSAQAAAEQLVRQANQQGGPDNITAVVVKLAGQSPMGLQPMNLIIAVAGDCAGAVVPGPCAAAHRQDSSSTCWPQRPQRQPSRRRATPTWTPTFDTDGYTHMDADGDFDANRDTHVTPTPTSRLPRHPRGRRRRLRRLPTTPTWTPTATSTPTAHDAPM